MISIAFHLKDWEEFPGLDNPRSQMFRWLNDLQAFDVDKLVMIDSTSIQIGNYYKHQNQEVAFEKFPELEDYLDTLPEETNKVVLGLPREGVTSVSITDFKHPVGDVVYIVGPDDGDVILRKSYSNLTWVYLTLPKEGGTLYAHTAAMLTLYNRYLKS